MEGEREGEREGLDDVGEREGEREGDVVGMVGEEVVGDPVTGGTHTHTKGRSALQTFPPALIHVPPVVDVASP